MVQKTGGWTVPLNNSLYGVKIELKYSELYSKEKYCALLKMMETAAALPCCQSSNNVINCKKKFQMRGQKVFI